MSRLKLSYLSKYPRVSVSSLHSGDDLRLAVLLDPDHWRIGPKDWSIVIDVFNQDKHRLGDEVALA